MRHALPRLSLIATLFCGLVVTTSAQDFEIRLVRPVQVGDRYGVIANGTREQHITMTVAGQPAPARDEVLSVALTAEAEVLGVTPGGREAKTRFIVAKLTRTVGAQTDETLPAGTVVVAERTGAKTEFQVAEAPAAPDLAKVLALVISLESDQGANDDTIFGTKERRRIGDTWPIDSAAAAADLATKDEMKIDSANITGTATLAEVLKTGLRVTATVEMKQVGIPLPPGVTVTASAFTTQFSGVFPIDATKRASNTAMTMDGKVECSGKAGDKDLVMVLTMKAAKEVTFTTP